MTDAATTIIDKLGMPLHNRSMLAILNISQWEPKKADRKLAEDAAKATGGDAEMHEHKIRLLAKGALKKIGGAVGGAKAFFYDNTSPWLDGGEGRILYGKNYFPFLQGMREFERKFDEAKAVLIPLWPQLIEEVRPMLGDSFDPEDYPPASEIASHFSMRVRVKNLPAAADFRVPSLGDAEQALIRAEIERSQQEAIAGVYRHLWGQIHEQVTHMADGLKKYQEREEKGVKTAAGTFHDTLVLNLRELVERLPRMNVAEDERLEQMRVRLLRELCQPEPEDLRTSPLTRQATMARADAILKDVGEFLG